MSSVDVVIQVLTEAKERLDETRVWEAYIALVAQIILHLTGKPYNAESMLTDTQMVFIKHGLRALRPAARLDIIEAANTLRSALNGEPPAQTTPPHEPAPVTLAETGPLVAAETATMETVAAQTTAPTTYEVFLIGTRRDAATLRRVQAELSATHLRVWTDEGLRQGSDEWQAAVEAAMKASAAAVVLLTPDAKKDRWVEQQLHYALAYNRSVFPLLARGKPEDCTPLILRDLPAGDIRREPVYRATMRRLKRALMAYR
jgi:hypothetical protein